MPRNCTVCSHPESFRINEALILEGKSNRATARQYDLHHDAIRRHKMHIPELLVKASESFELAEADTLLTRIRQWTARIENVLDEVERQRDYPLFLKGVGNLRPFLELLGELSKELQRQPEINVTISEDVQNSIINALSEYPEARSRVIHALEAATGDGDG